MCVFKDKRLVKSTVLFVKVTSVICLRQSCINLGKLLTFVNLQSLKRDLKPKSDGMKYK